MGATVGEAAARLAVIPAMAAAAFRRTESTTGLGPPNRSATENSMAMSLAPM
jgi:hypothetical protein